MAGFEVLLFWKMNWSALFFGSFCRGEKGGEVFFWCKLHPADLRKGFLPVLSFYVSSGGKE